MFRRLSICPCVGVRCPQEDAAQRRHLVNFAAERRPERDGTNETGTRQRHEARAAWHAREAVSPCRSGSGAPQAPGLSHYKQVRRRSFKSLVLQRENIGFSVIFFDTREAALAIPRPRRVIIVSSGMEAVKAKTPALVMRGAFWASR